MKISFYTENNKLYCRYAPDDGVDFLKESKSREYRLKHLFTVTYDQLRFNDDGDSVSFEIAILVDNGYYSLNKDIFNLGVSFFIHEEVELSYKLFVTSTNINILHRIENLVDSDVYIGGSHEPNIPISEYLSLVDNFPNTTEVKKYAEARVTAALRDYLSIPKDYIAEYEGYLNRKIVHKTRTTGETTLDEAIYQNEADKYRIQLDKLKDMLANSEVYSEDNWSKEISEIITLVFPKYLYAIENVSVKTRANKTKKIDYVLTDASGYVDVLEIKKTHSIKVISKTMYRDNYVAAHDLTGALQQTEKYIHHLNQNPSANEGLITKKLSDKTIDVKIRNPRGLVLLGTKEGLTKEQLEDFEIIRRKYKNIAEIITYDELIEILERLIKKFTIKAL